MIIQPLTGNSQQKTSTSTGRGIAPLISTSKPILERKTATRVQTQPQQEAGVFKVAGINFNLGQIFPQTSKEVSQIRVDPLSLKADPKKAIGAAWDSLKGAVMLEADRLKKTIGVQLNPKSTGTERAASQLEEISSRAGLVFAPISALFSAANEIPVLGSVSKLITIPFTAVGEGATSISNGLIDKLPISKQAKEQLKPGVGEIFALASQLALGKISEVGSKKVGELSKKYGLQDAITIKREAEKLAKSAQKEIKQGEAYTPEDLRNRIIGSDLEKTPEGKKLIKATFDAEKEGKKIQVGEKIVEQPKEVTSLEKIPSVETAPKYTSAKDFAEGAYSAKPEQKIGLIDSNKITARDPVEVTSKEFQALKADIQKNGFKEPIRVVMEKGKMTTVDGSQRLTVAQEIGMKVPTIINKGEVSGLKTISEIFEQNKAVTEKTPSKIARSIEQKAIEQKLTKGFEGLAGYDKVTIKEQARLAQKALSDVETARAIIRGEKSLPEGLRGTALITAAEELAKKTKNADLQYELANSPLVSETSLAAQELRLAAERQPDSLTLRLKELKKAREDAIKAKTGLTVDKAVKAEVENIRSKVKVPDKHDWGRFIQSIEC